MEAAFAMVVHFISPKLSSFHLAVLTTRLFSFWFCSVGINPRTSSIVGKCFTAAIYGQHKLLFDSNHSFSFDIITLVLKLFLKEQPLATHLNNLK